MSKLQKKGVPRHAGDPCPDPGVHQHGSIYSSSSSMASRDNIFGPDGKLSSASKFRSTMRYALRFGAKLTTSQVLLLPSNTQDLKISQVTHLAAFKTRVRKSPITDPIRRHILLAEPPRSLRTKVADLTFGSTKPASRDNLLPLLLLAGA